jgi:hypothetical protein
VAEPDAAPARRRARCAEIGAIFNRVVGTAAGRPPPRQAAPPTAESRRQRARDGGPPCILPVLTGTRFATSRAKCITQSSERLRCELAPRSAAIRSAAGGARVAAAAPGRRLRVAARRIRTAMLVALGTTRIQSDSLVKQPAPPRGKAPPARLTVVPGPARIPRATSQPFFSPSRKRGDGAPKGATFFGHRSRDARSRLEGVCA